MIEIYKRDEFNGKLKIIATFDTFDALFQIVNDTYIAQAFGYVDTMRHLAGTKLGDHFTTSGLFTFGGARYCYVAYDNGKFVTPDRLVGLARAFKKVQLKKWQKRWNRKFDCGAKKSAYGGFRKIRTTQERKWAHAWDDEEFAPRPRAARQGHNLPDSWDDYFSRAQKSWKWQSKRKHQWKPKTKLIGTHYD